VSCIPTLSEASVSLAFDPRSNTPPEGPGVYVVYHLASGQPFYVGEARNLLRRIAYLFRCHRNDNPHPCHKRHLQVHGLLPEVDVFCATYGVKWYSTAEMTGRIEIEEALQEAFGTNRKEFYQSFDPKGTGYSEPNPAAEPCCVGDHAAHRACQSCPVWRELSTNLAYRNPAGVAIPTMGGRAALLFFRYNTVTKKIEVWRLSGNPNFEFDKAAAKAICQRYQSGLKCGILPPVHMLGGTAYFGQPTWPTAVLGRYDTPYAAAVIRHALRSIDLRSLCIV
jgi:hypothetical protein